MKDYKSHITKDRRKSNRLLTEKKFIDASVKVVKFRDRDIEVNENFTFSMGI